MEEIKVGEYVRTKGGSIEKVKTVNKFCTITYRSIVSAIVEEKTNWYSESGREINEEDVEKHSFNIIDLIEKDDYVNGKRVIYVASIENKYDEEELCVFVEETQDCIEAKDIKTILTKEKYKVNCYEV